MSGSMCTYLCLHRGPRSRTKKPLPTSAETWLGAQCCRHTHKRGLRTPRWQRTRNDDTHPHTTAKIIIINLLGSTHNIGGPRAQCTVRRGSPTWSERVGVLFKHSLSHVGARLSKQHKTEDREGCITLQRPLHQLCQGHANAWGGGEVGMGRAGATGDSLRPQLLFRFSCTAMRAGETGIPKRVVPTMPPGVYVRAVLSRG